MKIVKKIVNCLAGLVVILAVIGLFLPEVTQVSRSIVIDRNISVVFEQVNGYRNFNRWSPWAAIDPKAEYTFSGPDLGVGATMSWRSDNPEVGTGSQKIIGSIENKQIEVLLSFDHEHEAYAYYDLHEPLENTTEISWRFKTVHGYDVVSRYFGLLLDRWVGDKYEVGLSNLKAYLERGQ